MGACYKFTCPKCGYEAKVSGGKDRGFSVSVQTMTCMNCSILVDVHVGHYEHDGNAGNEIFIHESGSCPKCSETNLEEWNENRSCPKCGSSMDQGEMTVLWD